MKIVNFDQEVDIEKILNLDSEELLRAYLT